MAGLRARLGLTEGQGYTVVVLAVVAALLLSSLTGLTGRIAEVAATPLAPPVATTTTATTAVPTESTVEPFRPFPPVTSGIPAVLPGPVAVTPPPLPGGEPPAPPLEGEEPPAPTRCPTQDVIDLGRQVLTAVDAVAGGLVPDATVVSALAVATGCSAMDPTILLIAGLIEIGQTLPDLGLDAIELPTLPFINVPAPVIDLLQPLREVTEPICGTIGIPVVITSQVGPHYPYPLDVVFAVSLFYALATCGQIHG